MCQTKGRFLRLIKARSNARVFHDASGTMDDSAWRMLSIGKEIGMLMLDMYYDLGDMECSMDTSNSAE